MASGSSGRPSSASKGFDFASDDILCSYEDYGAQDGSNGGASDPAIGVSSVKPDFHKSRMARSSVFPTISHSPQEDSFHQEVMVTVEKTMKKYADNLMRFLEGLSSRMSQLELYCYNVDKSIGEMRSDLIRDHGEVDVKLKSLDKHVQEVHRSVQILRDKQELAEAQKELAKLHLAQKESSSASHSQHSEERATLPVSDPKKIETSSDTNNQQLALALPHQVAPPQPPLPTRPVEQQQSVTTHSQVPPQNMNQQQSQVPPQSMNQQHSYYLPVTQLPNPSAQTNQGQYFSSDTQYRTPQAQSQVSPAQPVLPHTQYQQQWSQQTPQQVQASQQPSVQQPQMRPPSSTPLYPSYASQPQNSSLSETLPNSMPMQVPFSGIPQPGANRIEMMSYGFGVPGIPVQQSQPQSQPPQHVKGAFGSQPGDGYPVPGSHPSHPAGNANAYMVYDSEGPREHHPHQSPFPPGSYPPSSSNLRIRNSSPPHFLRNNPYSELVEKLVSMGYRGEHVVNVIQRMEENGQPVDFNSVLDRLNGHSSSGGQRGGW